MALRLEPIDGDHQQIAALLYGPLVLFAITDNQVPLNRTELLAATRVGKTAWHLLASGSTIKLLHFTEITDEQYSTYLNLT